MNDFFGITDEKFEQTFLKFCTIITFVNAKKMSISSCFVFLLQNPKYMQALQQICHEDDQIRLARRIIHTFPQIAKSKTIQQKASEAQKKHEKSNRRRDHRIQPVAKVLRKDK